MNLLADGLEGFIENIGREIGRAGVLLRRWLSRVAVPVHGVRLHTPDGAEYTGVVLVAGNRVVAMLVARELHAQLSQPVVTPPPRQQDYGYREDPRWREPEKPKSPKTVNNHLIVLAKLLAVAVEWERLSRAPKLKKLKMGDPKIDFLTFDEAHRLLDALYNQWRVMVLLGMKAGLRIGELLALRWDHLDLKAGRVNVQLSRWKDTEGTPKGGKSGDPSAPASA